MKRTMMVVMPTRGRPHKAREAYESFSSTQHQDGVVMSLVLDRTDPEIDEYYRLMNRYEGRQNFTFMVLNGNMVQRTNEAALIYANHFQYIGWSADDQIFRTRAWDKQVIDLLEQSHKFVHTNDGFQEHRKAANIFTHASVVQALGWLALPTLQHLYVDDVWKELAGETGCYAPYIMIEHMHPYVSKAEWDEHYLSYNTPEKDSADSGAYRAWKRKNKHADIERIRDAHSWSPADGGKREEAGPTLSESIGADVHA
jgi:hypothetical protein